MIQAKAKRGGARNGAGRKPLPLDQRAVGVTVRVRPVVASLFSAWCKARGISQSKAFAQWVEQSLMIIFPK